MHGLHSYWVKTMIQNVWSACAPAPITTAGQIVDVTYTFMYLGSDINSSGYCSPDIRRRQGLASSTMGQLDGVWRNQAKHIDKDTPRLCMLSPVVALQVRNLDITS